MGKKVNPRQRRKPKNPIHITEKGKQKPEVYKRKKDWKNEIR